MQLRPYQIQTLQAIEEAWAAGNRNVCCVSPTGSGKTVIFAHTIANTPGTRFAIAHRQELICQISMALAKYGVRHSIQAPVNLIRWIIRLHTRTFNAHFYDPDSKCILSSAQTLLNRAGELSRELADAQLWVIDESHHITRDNMWGKVVALFPPDCRGLGVTATPLRSDGRGLGSHADGVMDTMVEGPNMRDLITAGYLSDYRIFAPRTAIDLSGVTIGSTGDYSKPKLTTAVRKSTIVGDVVEHYLRIAPGKPGVTFVTDVQTGRDTVERFRAAGVPAEIVHAKTGDKIRQKATDALRAGDIKNLVNVDIFGEGFDLPAIEVTSFARPTESYGLYVQQFGRGLRIMDGKTHGVIIDHVGNVLRHGLPDTPRIWSLDSREKKTSSTGVKVDPVRVCRSCAGVYEPYLKICPYCGFHWEPDGRATVEQVEGDLTEIDPSVLAAMRGEIARIDAPESVVGDKLRYAGKSPLIVAGAMKQHRLRREAQVELRDAMALWAGKHGGEVWMKYRDFYRDFGIDVMGAQALGRPEAEKLMMNIYEGMMV